MVVPLGSHIVQCLLQIRTAKPALWHLGSDIKVNARSLLLLLYSILVRVPIFPIVVCVRSAYVIGAGVGFRVESGAVALLQLDL